MNKDKCVESTFDELPNALKTRIQTLRDELPGGLGEKALRWCEVSVNILGKVDKELLERLERGAHLHKYLESKILEERLY